MVYQLLVHHGYDLVPLAFCLVSLCQQPVKRGRFNGATHNTHVSVISLGNVSVLLVLRGINGKKRQPWYRLTDIGQGIRVPQIIISIAEIAIDRSKFFCRYSFCRNCLITVKVFGRGIPDIMVTRNDKGLYAGLESLPKHTGNPLMTNLLAVFRQIATYQEDVSLMDDGAVNNCLKGFYALAEHFSVSTNVISQGIAFMDHQT